MTLIKISLYQFYNHSIKIFLSVHDNDELMHEQGSHDKTSINEQPMHAIIIIQTTHTRLENQTIISTL